MKKNLYVRYGEMKPGFYEVLKENYDHFIVKWRGQSYCVPKSLFNDEVEEFVDYEYDNEYVE